jgi:hypothetical protein
MTPAAAGSLLRLRELRADRARTALREAEAATRHAEAQAAAAAARAEAWTRERPAREAAIWDPLMGKEVPQADIGDARDKVALLRQREAELAQEAQKARAAADAAQARAAEAAAALAAADRRRFAFVEVVDTLHRDARRAA